MSLEFTINFNTSAILDKTEATLKYIIQHLSHMSINSNDLACNISYCKFSCTVQLQNMFSRTVHFCPCVY